MGVPDKKSWLISINETKNAIHTVVCCHYAGGGASVFRGWDKYFPKDVRIVAIQLPGREERFSEEPLLSIGKVIDGLFPEISSLLNETASYSIFGHSIGALVGFELARKVRSILLPKVLIISAAGAPQLNFKRELIGHLPDKDFVEKLKIYNGLPESLIENNELLNMFIPMLRADLSILEGYKYKESQPLEFPILALGGSEDPIISAKDIGSWCVQTRQLFTMRIFNGDHFFIKNNQEQVLKYISQTIQENIKASKIEK